MHAITTVGELNRHIRTLLENTVAPLWVTGELSNVTRAPSGHWYFTLKDREGQIRCTLWRTRAASLQFVPSNGLQVDVYAQVTLYESRGDYQLSIESMRQAGAGNLWLAFQKLKQDLEAQGLFQNDRKRPIPTAPNAIGIITSPKAAALQDVLSRLRERAPGLNIIVYPSSVQGIEAHLALIHAIDIANARQEVDILIICRGGGSLEDLWCFNHEMLAYTISQSIIPIISAVGHETDFSISDFVADLRCATPTAAAEIVSARALQQPYLLHTHYDRARRMIQHTLQQVTQRLDNLSLRLRHPATQCQQQQQRLQQLTQRLTYPIKARLSAAQQTQQHLCQRLSQRRPNTCIQQQKLIMLARQQYQVVTRQQRELKTRLNSIQGRLIALSPEAILTRGYAIVTNAQGMVIRHHSETKKDELINIVLAQSQLRARIEQ